MELYFLREDKKYLARKLKDSEKAGTSKRSRVEDNSIAFEDHKRFVAAIETKYKQIYRDDNIIQASKAGGEAFRSQNQRSIEASPR